MLDAFIIEKIRRERERQERARTELPRLQIPDIPPLEQRPEHVEHEEREGGVVIVDFTI